MDHKYKCKTIKLVEECTGCTGDTVITLAGTDFLAEIQKIVTIKKKKGHIKLSVLQMIP